MRILKLSSAILLTIVAASGCESSKTTAPAPSQAPVPASLVAKPTPSPSAAPKPAANVTVIKAYHISGTIDEAKQEDDVCDVTVPFTVKGTLEFKFTPSSPTAGTYEYSGPFNAKGSGPYEIYDSGKMLISGKGCIMGNNCAEYSHDWKAERIDPKNCKPK